MKLEKLKAKRKEKGYTREDIAALLGISKFTYRSYEQGDRQIKIDKLKAISKILECTIDELI